MYISVTAFAWAAAIFDFFKKLPEGVQTALHLDKLVDCAGKYLPMFGQNLGWLVPAGIGLVLGLILHFAMPRKKA